MLEDLGTERGVALHDEPLVVVELARLAEDRVGHADLADVVEHAGEPHARNAVVVEAERAGHRLGVAANGLAVAGAAAEADVDGLGQVEHRREKALALDLARDVAADGVGQPVLVHDGAVAAGELGRVQRLVARPQQGGGGLAPSRGRSRCRTTRSRGRPESSNSSASFDCSRALSRRAPSLSASGSSSANSSPPVRAVASMRRWSSLRIHATRWRIASPCVRPSLSLTALKLSRSTVSSDSDVPPRRARSISRSSPSRKPRRFCRLVSRSVRAASCRRSISSSTRVAHRHDQHGGDQHRAHADDPPRLSRRWAADAAPAARRS